MPVTPITLPRSNGVSVEVGASANALAEPSYPALSGTVVGVGVMLLPTPKQDAEKVARETRHLASRGHLSALAGRLELKHAREWDQTAGGARPREGVVLLRSFGPEVDEIVGLLRTPAPAPRGVAVLELLLIRVYGSTLYVGEIELELWRTRFLLNRGWASEDPDLSVSPTAE